MFNFKSSGVKVDDSKFTESDPESKLRPISIKTPLEPGRGRTELYKMHEDPLEAIADNLKNLVQTNMGERLGRFDLGCNLKSILFDRNSQNDSEYEQTAIASLNEQVRKYLPLVVIDDVSFSPVMKSDYTDRSSLAKVEVNIVFSVSRLRRFRNKLVVILYNGG